MCDAVLSLARRFRVLPLWPILPSWHGDGFICGCGKGSCNSPGKHPLGPLVPNGVKDASQDPRIVENWWRSRPDANIGIATGSGIAVLDIDPRHGGNVTIAELQKRHGRLPQTVMVRTGGGGWHLYFTGDAGNSVGALGQGLDIRGNGGFVVAPPSLHVSGNRYEWRGDRDAEIAPLPEWIVSAVRTKRPKSERTGWQKAIRDTVEEGRRNDVLTRLVGHLFRKYLSPDLVFDLVCTWNTCRCRPPLNEDEISIIVESIYGRELKRRGENE